MKNWGIAFLLVALFASSAQAQHKCGVGAAEGKQIREQMLINRNEMRDFVFERNAITYIPVRFFLVAKNDGTGRASEKTGLDALCLLNEHYADQDIQFYLKEFKYINNSTIYSNPTSFSGSNALANQMIYNAMNIFMVNEMAEEGVLAYYQPGPGPNGNDWIVCLDNYAGEKLVITHEVGHFFSLNHTFYGWECTGGWDGSNGNQAGAFTPCGEPAELVSGSNCNTAADMICDTPADYMFPNNNCAYTLNVQDVNGQPLSPDFTNFMNYVYGCNEYHFTDGQKEEIQNSLFSSSRNYIRPNYTPNLANVSGAPTIVSPANAQIVNTYNSVELEWTSLPGADRYLIEVTNPNESIRRYIVNSNTTVLTDLSANSTYLWKVLGFNEYATCGSYSSTKILKTGNLVSDTSTEEQLTHWSISPNPSSSGGPIMLNFESPEATEVDIEIYTPTGQMIHRQSKQRFAFGKNSVELETGSLPVGMYLVHLKTPQGATTKKFTVVQ